MALDLKKKSRICLRKKTDVNWAQHWIKLICKIVGQTYIDAEEVARTETMRAYNDGHRLSGSDCNVDSVSTDNTNLRLQQHPNAVEERQ